MPNVRLVQDEQDETLITPSTVVQSNILTGPPGPAGIASNTFAREYVYPQAMPVQLPPATVTTPQPYAIKYWDANGTLWALPPNGTAWQIVNTVAPGA